MKLALGLRRAPLAIFMAGLASLAATELSAQTDDVHIVIEQSYNFRPPSELTYQTIDNYELPLLDVVEDMVFATGRDVVGTGDAAIAQTTIEVTVEGMALSRSYLERDGQYLYTGAILDGAVLLKASSGNTYYREFYSLTAMPIRPPTIDPGYDKPHNAPFVVTFEKPGGIAKAVAEVMVAVWGIEAIIPAAFDAGVTVRADVVSLMGDVGDPIVVPDLIDILEADGSDAVRQQAAWSLGRIGDGQAVPHLIDALNDQSHDVRWFSAWSLRTITGETFGVSYDDWSGWWAEQGNQTGG